MNKTCLIVLLSTLFLHSSLKAQSTSSQNLEIYRLQTTNECVNCSLSKLDLINLDLKRKNLTNIDLSDSNLSGSNLDGANLRGANLKYTTLTGASLRNTNLKGAIMEGTDLRYSDLTGAELDYNGLSKSHWSYAKGINPKYLTFPQTYNAAITYYSQNSYREATRYFSYAINKQPLNPSPYIARAASLNQQEDIQGSINDLRSAASIYKKNGDVLLSSKIIEVSKKILERSTKNNKKGGSGLFVGLIQGLSVFRYISPIPF